MRESLSSSKPVVVWDGDGELVNINQSGEELFGRSKEELVGLSYCDLMPHSCEETGRKFQKAIYGEIKSGSFIVKDSKDAKFNIETSIELVEDRDETMLVCTYESVEPVDDDDEADGGTRFEDISDSRVKEISQNIRVDCPSGEIPLEKMMLDIIVGHQELNQYKKGALTFYSCLSERLEEEKEINPDSDECVVLEEIKDSAFGLYLRLHRGDMEVNGDREGKYSGYLNL